MNTFMFTISSLLNGTSFKGQYILKDVTLITFNVGMIYQFVLLFQKGKG